MNAELALATLEFAPNKAARVIYKVLASAVANGNYDAQSVIVKSCRIDAGPVLRRMSPRARGRANMIRKPTAHILVEVATESEIAKAKEVAKTKAIKPKKENNKKVAESSESKKAITKAPKKDIVKAESTKAQKPKSASKDSQDSKVSKDSKATKPKAPKEVGAEKATKKPSTAKARATKNKDEDK